MGNPGLPAFEPGRKKEYCVMDKRKYLIVLWILSLVVFNGCFVAQSKKGTINNTPNPLNRLNSNTVLIAAHRGGYENDYKDKAPENSVVNIKNAVSKGFDVYETDLQRTKDGVFVIVHDQTIERETDGHGEVKNITLAELKKLKKRYTNGVTSQEPVATFEEFLQHGKNRITFKVDMKPGIQAYFKEIVSLVKKHKMMDSVLFRVEYKEADFFSKYVNEGNPYSENLLMFMVDSKQQVDFIEKTFSPLSIQVNIGSKNPWAQSLEVIKYAASKDILVETHVIGNEKQWGSLVHAGVRMLHSQTPLKTLDYLRSINKHK